LYYICHKIITLAVLLIIAAISLNAQLIQQSLYNSVPQNTYQKIGSFSEHKNYFSIPTLGYNNLSVSNSGFAINDFVDDNGKVTGSAVDEVLSSLNGIQHLNFGYKNELINIGFSVGEKNFFMINMGTSIDVAATYTPDLMEILMYGRNGKASYGVNYDLSGTSYNITAFTELGFGFQHKLNDQLSFGARARYLSGLVNSNAKFEDVSLIIDPANDSISATSIFTAYDYGVSEFIMDDLQGPNNKIPNFSNAGFAIDFGADYKVNDKLSFNFNVVDLGFITWKNGRFKYNDISNNGYYEGLDFDQLHIDSTGLLDAFEEIQGIYDLNEERKNYSTSLPTSLYLGGQYSLTNKVVFDGLLSGRIINKKFYPSYTVAGGFQIYKKLQTKLSYSIINNTYTNIGFGFSGNIGPFQLYVLADNLPKAFNVYNAKYLNLSFGLNVAVFRDKDATSSEESSEDDN